MSDDEDRVLDRVYSEGTMWLNPVFQFEDGSFRVLRSVRITRLEAIWFVIVTALWMLIGFGLYAVLPEVWPFDLIFAPFVIPVEALLFGWVLGRRFATMSPLRRRTGEGTGVWVFQMIRRGIVWLSSKMGKAEPYSYCVTGVHGNGRYDIVPCVVWLGSARSRRVPSTDEQMSNVSIDGYGEAPFDAPPRGRPMPRINRGM